MRSKSPDAPAPYFAMFIVSSYARHPAATPLGDKYGMQVSWNPGAARSATERSKLPSAAFAFPRERKEPLTDAHHVRSAIARFAQVDGVDDRERALAFDNIKAAAAYYGVTVHAKTWRDLF